MTTKVPVELSSTPGIVDGSNATAITIDSSERVGIGETSPLGKIHAKVSDTGASASAQGNLLVLEDTENGLSILSGTSAAGYINFGDSDDNDIGMIIYDHSANAMRFWTNAAERMRITSDGKLFINTTAAVRGSEQVSIDGGSADCFALKTHAAGAVVRKQSVTNGFIFLFENSSASAVGSITTDASNTTYNTSSDYRLKENIEPMQNGLDRLQQLNPVKFSWKETGIESEGFIAHEVDEVFSDCIYGEKDGKEIQSMDYGRITPLLVKAIQELTAEVEELKTKLESK